MNGEGRAWIVISRPDRLPTAIATAQALRAEFRGGVHLLREESKWWERAHWLPYAGQFDGIHAFSRVNTCRGLRDLPRLYRESAERREAIAQLPIDKGGDLIVCVGGILTISNATISAHPQVRKVLCVAEKVYRDLTRVGERTRYRFTTSGWLQNRIVEPMAGLNRTLHFKPRINPGGDGVRVERLQKDPDSLYHRIVVMNNGGNDVSDNPKIVAAKFPSVGDLRDLPHVSDKNGNGKRRQVIFFGTPFLLIHNVSPEVYVERLNECLDYLRRNFTGYALIYRPHPNETKEAKRLKLQEFRVEDDREAAELYFLRNYHAIAAVFSVSSTVSRTALNNGINGYAMYPVFPFSEKQAQFFGGVMGDVPSEFTVRDLNSPPIPYQPVAVESGRSFAEAIKMAAGRRAEIPIR
jgi:hypothetical protein